MAVGPTITGERVTLVPFSEEFLSERYVGWLNDPQVTRFSEQSRRRHTVESCREFLRSFDTSDDFFWAVTVKGLGHIGNITAKIEPWDRVSEVAILMGEPHLWGRGYGAEAFGMVCRWLLDGHGMRKVFAGTLAVNTGMLGVMRKLGMVDDGIRRRQALLNGQEIDVVYAALFRDPA